MCEALSRYALVQLHGTHCAIWVRIDQIDSVADAATGGSRVTLRRGGWHEVSETADEVAERIRPPTP
jgi:hypothetical protein